LGWEKSTGLVVCQRLLLGYLRVINKGKAGETCNTGGEDE